MILRIIVVCYSYEYTTRIALQKYCCIVGSNVTQRNINNATYYSSSVALGEGTCMFLTSSLSPACAARCGENYNLFIMHDHLTATSDRAYSRARLSYFSNTTEQTHRALHVLVQACALPSLAPIATQVHTASASPSNNWWREDVRLTTRDHTTPLYFLFSIFLNYF